MFERRWKIATLSGFPIYIHASWILIAVLIAWTLATAWFPQAEPELPARLHWVMGIAGALGLFASVVLHELGHAWVGRRLGIHVRDITLFVFGGVAAMEGEPPRPKAELLMALAGPATSVLLGLLALGLVAAGRLVGASPVELGVVEYLGWVNLALAAFNLLPAFPLDGGRVARAALWARHGDLRRATKTMSKLGQGLGTGLLAAGVATIVFSSVVAGIWWVLLGLFLRAAARQSWEQHVLQSSLRGGLVRDFLHEDLVTVDPRMTLDAFVYDVAFRQPHRVYPVVRDGEVFGAVDLKEVQKVPRHAWPDRQISEVLHPVDPSRAVSPDDDVLEALALMNSTGETRLLVLDHGKLAGLLTAKDLMAYLAVRLELEGDDAATRGRAPLPDERGRDVSGSSEAPAVSRRRGARGTP